MKASRERTRLLSKRMEMLILALMGVITLSSAYVLWLAWADPDWLGDVIARELAIPRPTQLSEAALLLAMAFLAQVGLLLWALQTLRRAFREIALHDIVGTESARLMRLSGIAFFINTIAMVLAPPLISGIISLAVPANQHFLTISFNSQDLLAMLLSGMLIVFGHLLSVAAQIDDDNRQFV